MKQYINLIKYHYITYLKTNKYIMPMLVWISVLVISYHVKPVDIVSSFMLTAVALNFIMVWFGLSYFDSVDMVSEQILLLKVKKRSKYYLSKYYFMILIAIVLSLIGVLLPVFQNVINGFDMFQRGITVQDVVFGIIVHIILAILGLSISLLCQPICMKNRKMALLIISLIPIIGLTESSIIAEYSIFKYILWIFPPTGKIVDLFYNCESFSGKAVLIAAAFGGIYSFILIVISQMIIKKKLY